MKDEIRAEITRLLKRYPSFPGEALPRTVQEKLRPTVDDIREVLHTMVVDGEIGLDWHGGFCSGKSLPTRTDIPDCT